MMHRVAGLLAGVACALGACTTYDTANNALSVSYLVDDRTQIESARQQAVAECARFNRVARLSNVTQFQHVLVVFDCRPGEAVGRERRIAVGD
jgi:hypothetical protein